MNSGKCEMWLTDANICSGSLNNIVAIHTIFHVYACHDGWLNNPCITGVTLRKLASNGLSLSPILLHESDLHANHDIVHVHTLAAFTP